MNKDIPSGNLSLMISIQAIDKNWSDITKFLERLVDEKCSLEDMYNKITDGDWHLWVATDYDTNMIYAVAITAFIEYPRSTNLRMIFVSGDGENWPIALKVFEHFALVNDCHEVEVLGRKGWERVLRDRGYELKSVTLRKRIN